MPAEEGEDQVQLNPQRHGCHLHAEESNSLQKRAENQLTMTCFPDASSPKNTSSRQQT